MASFVVKAEATRRSRLLTGVTLAVALLGFLKLFYFPRLAVIRGARDHAVALEDQIARKNRMLSESKAGSDALEVKTATLQRYLASHSSVAGLLKLLAQAQPGITVNRVDVVSRDAHPEATKVLLSLDLDGSFVEIGRFLDRVENSDFLVQMQSVDISRVDREIRRCTGKVKFWVYLGSAKT